MKDKRRSICRVKQGGKHEDAASLNHPADLNKRAEREKKNA
jgi:hypothetical protein